MQLLQEPGRVHSHSRLVASIKALLQQQWEVRVVHVFREANYATDCLANHARDLPLGNHRLHRPPAQVVDWIVHDRIGVSYTRITML